MCVCCYFCTLGDKALFGFDGYDLDGAEFGGGMEDIEVAREVSADTQEVSGKDMSGDTNVSFIARQLLPTADYSTI